MLAQETQRCALVMAMSNDVNLDFMGSAEK